VLIIRQNQTLLAAGYRDIEKLWPFQITCIREIGLISRGNIMLSRSIELRTLVITVGERGKRDVYCDKQVEEAVTFLNCVLKSLWGERGSRGIRKKLKSRSTAYL